jgi:anti-sigma factor RsiW
LSDSQFADLWSAATAAGQPVADAQDAHLVTCAQCRARYAAFVQWLDNMRDDAVAEADEAFPAERLAWQQSQVMRRIEALERPARVLNFPRIGRPITSTQGQVQRWVTAAAAAGLVIGLAAGQLFDIRNALSARREPVRPVQTARLVPQQVTTSNAAAGLATPVSFSVSDEALFFGGEPVRSSERVSMLQAMDDITPRARDLDRSR